MKKLRLGFIGLVAGVMAVPAFAAAAMLGPQPSLCASGDEASILVRATGFKNRAGKVRVRTFGGSPSTWFNKKNALKRVEYDVPANGPIEICMPVPGPGTYAVDVRHDVNNNSDTDRSDGIGASGNPRITLFDIIFGRKPKAQEVQVSVGRGTTVVPITVRYM